MRLRVVFLFLKIHTSCFDQLRGARTALNRLNFNVILMKQILQNLKTGETLIEEVPSPQIRSGYLKIKTSVSLVSAGTEGMLVGFGRSNYFDKARQQPEKVAQVINKVGTDGLIATIDTVMTRLDELQPLGYSNVGVII